MPPMATSSLMRKRPLGFKSASTGTRAPMRVKSSSFSATPAVWAMARRWSTALVEPPRAMTTVMAFSKASFVMMSSGRMPRLMRSKTAMPAARASAALAGEVAFCAELLGKDMPRASMALAMVLAVYMPPQEPAPGMAFSSISASSRSSSWPLACSPTASKQLTTSSFLSANFSRRSLRSRRSASTPVMQPGRMVPP